VQEDDSSDGTLFGTLAAGDGGHTVLAASLLQAVMAQPPGV